MNSEKTPLVIATSNTNKMKEIREFLKPLPFEFFSLRDFPNYVPLEEKGTTFEENASLKAIDAAKKLQKLVLADDSGIIVPSLKSDLKDVPGVLSKRYAHEKATDAENRKKLLRALRGKEGLDRSAYFECCIAIADPGGLKKCFRGRCEGIIVEMEKGNYGFGYDPLFQKYDYDKTFAELSLEIKNRISHRAKALEQAAIYLESYLR